MRRLWNWLRGRFLFHRLRYEARLVEESFRRQKANLVRIGKLRSKIKTRSTMADSIYESAVEDLERLRKEQQDDLATVELELDRARQEAERNHEELEGLRTKLEVCEKITIPTLEACCRMFTQRYDAEIAVQVRRQVLATEEERGD